jgi:hypothetical protein
MPHYDVYTLHIKKIIFNNPQWVVSIKLERIIQYFNHGFSLTTMHKAKTVNQQ